MTYTVTSNALKIDYTANTRPRDPDQPDQHSYFNLAGPASGDVLGHEIMIAADRYTPGDETLIPDRRVAPVKGTPLDFTTSPRSAHGSIRSRPSRSATITIT